MTDRARRPVYAVILAGGSGTRLWPLGRRAEPKQFLPIFGGKSLFRLAYERVAPLAGRGRILVVAGAGHAAAIRGQVPELPASALLLEGEGRDTAPSIALAALRITAAGGDGTMVVVPADHWIHPASALRAAVRRCLRAVDRDDGLLTIGIPPRSADTGMGYILPGASRGSPGVRRIARFVEKPPAAAARRLLRSRGTLWNSGIFVWRAGAILDALRETCPEVLAPLRAWASGAPRGRWRVPGSVMRRAPAMPIDRAVLERTGGAFVARGGFSWTDLGNWGAVADFLPRDAAGNAGIGRLLAVRSRRCLGVNQGGVTIFLDVRDIVAVRSGGTLLICHRRSAQEIKTLVRRHRRALASYL